MTETEGLDRSMTHPLSEAGPSAFWSRAVARADRARFLDLYRPKVSLARRTPTAFAGAGIGRHLAAALKAAGGQVLDAEPAPEAMPRSVAEAHGYGTWSARFGTLHTTRQVRQLLDDVAAGRVEPSLVWSRGRRHVDALRPLVDPRGLASADEVLLHRDYHLEKVSRLLQRTEVLVLTLDRVETWADRASGRVFPVCPGVVAGQFDPNRHHALTLRYADVVTDLIEIRRGLKRFREDLRLVLGVSPEPLPATGTGGHVLTAETRGKATLRAAFEDFAAHYPDVDYLPALEVLTTEACGGPFMDRHGRMVTPDGVARISDLFLSAHGFDPVPAPKAADLLDTGTAREIQALDALAP